MILQREREALFEQHWPCRAGGKVVVVVVVVVALEKNLRGLALDFQVV